MLPMSNDLLNVSILNSFFLEKKFFLYYNANVVNMVQDNLTLVYLPLEM